MVPAAPRSAAPPPAALVEGGVSTAGVVPRQCTRHQVANLQESEVVQEILVGHPVVEGLVVETVSDTPTPIGPQNPPIKGTGGRVAGMMKGRGVGGEGSYPKWH